MRPEDRELFFRVAEGNIVAVKALLIVGANPNAIDSREQTPLHYAANNGHTAIVEELITFC